ncbi:MAG: TOBE domain-containing protein, partial [Spirochaetota bacterium]
TPQEIYAHPINRFVADFIGKANFLEGRVDRLLSPDEAELDLLGVKIQAPMAKNRFQAGDKVLLTVRPESILLEPKRSGTLVGSIRESVYLGSHLVYEIGVAGRVLTVEISDPQDQIVFKGGEEVSVFLKKKSLYIIPLEEA